MESIRQENNEQGNPRFIMTVPVTWRPEPKKRTLLDRLRKKQAEQEQESTREFVFDPAVIAKVSQIISKINGLPDELYGDSLAELTSSLVEKHYQDMIYIIAVSTHKSVEEPSEELLRFIEMNFTFEMLKEGCKIARTQLHLDQLINCIVLLKGSSSILIPKSVQAEKDAQ